MSKERYRPNTSQRLRRVGATNGSLERDAVQHQLSENGLLDADGTLNHRAYFADLEQNPDKEDPIQEVINEVGISLDVLQVFAEEQARVPSTNGYALLDDQFPTFSPHSPRDIISEDYSEDSMP